MIKDQCYDFDEELSAHQNTYRNLGPIVQPCNDDDGDEKRSDLEYEISQKEINLEKLQRIASSGIPDIGSLRATIWKLLLGYLPTSRDLWEKELTESRLKYVKLKEEILLNPLTHPDLEFFSGESPLSRKDRESMRNILLLFAKVNPATSYIQGMNEVLAPLYYVFSTDSDEHNAANFEADTFSCFITLMSDSVDHFCKQRDSSSLGIHSTLSNLSKLLKTNDEELWHHLEYKTKADHAASYSGVLHHILRIWDISLLSDPFGIQEMLLRICCAMLMCIKSKLLNGDFTDNLKLLQHFPKLDVEHLLQIAQGLTLNTSSFHSTV